MVKEASSVRWGFFID